MFFGKWVVKDRIHVYQQFLSVKCKFRSPNQAKSGHCIYKQDESTFLLVLCVNLHFTLAFISQVNHTFRFPWKNSILSRTQLLVMLYFDRTPRHVHHSHPFSGEGQMRMKKVYLQGHLHPKSLIRLSIMLSPRSS